jgi:hypothetical protein
LPKKGEKIKEIVFFVGIFAMQEQARQSEDWLIKSAERSAEKA